MSYREIGRVKIIIIGGGFIGQLIKHLFWPRARIFDWKAHAPSILARSLGPQYLWEPIPELPCRTFMVHTMVDGKDATELSIRAYKDKVGKTQDGSDWRAQFRPWMPGYDCVVPRVEVEYGKRILRLDISAHRFFLLDGSAQTYDWLISTIPLPSLLTMMGSGKLFHGYDTFKFRRIYIQRSVIGLPGASRDMQVNYISMATPVYRQTIREGQIFTESLDPLPGPDVTSLMPGKIYPHGHAAGLVHDLRECNVLCFGRYATWSPDELAHETLRHAREYQRSMGQ